jgi:hypothetical protein
MASMNDSGNITIESKVPNSLRDGKIIEEEIRRPSKDFQPSTFKTIRLSGSLRPSHPDSDDSKEISMNINKRSETGEYPRKISLEDLNEQKQCCVVGKCMIF